MPTNQVCLWFLFTSLGGGVAVGTSLVIWDLTQQNATTLLAVSAAGGAAHAGSCQIKQAETQAERLPRLCRHAVALCEDTGALPMAQLLHPCRSPYPPAWGQQFNAIKKT